MPLQLTRPLTCRLVSLGVFAMFALVLAGSAAAQSIELDRPMGESLARAMLGRFGYGATIDSIASAARMSPRAYIERGIFEDSALPAIISSQIADMPASQPIALTWTVYGPGGSERDDLKNDQTRKKEVQQLERLHARSAIKTRLLAMANSDNQAHEVLFSFWLNHFSIYAPKGFGKILAGDYARHIEAAMKADSFEALLRASFFHPAMQVYLDNAQSTAPNSQAARFAANRGKKPGINENLARELMELHTLGVDAGYTQTDVQELARIISGAGVWRANMNDRVLDRVGAVRKELFLFDPRRHDFEAKRLLGQNFPPGHGVDEIDRALHLLAAHPATARHISRKLALRFLSDTPPETVVKSMTDAFLQSGGSISATLDAMLQSPQFAMSIEKQVKFKEPLDQLLSVARAACQSQPIGNAELLAASAMDAGQAPFMRTTPDGYGAREADWLSPAAMAKRIRFAMGVATNRIPLAQADPDNSGDPARLKEMNERKQRFMQGSPCQPDLQAIETTLGPLSSTTSAAITELGPKEQMAALLSSPEALHR
ncbi:MAG TPA: DUF1800 domain-containing protein [Nitrosospira sp.]